MLLHFAGGRTGEPIGDYRALGHFESREPLRAMPNHFFRSDAPPGYWDDVDSADLAPALIRHTDHRALADVRKLGDCCLDLGWINVLAARDVHVLLAIHDLVKAVFVHHRGIAGDEPTVAKRLGRRLRLVPVTTC